MAVAQALISRRLVEPGVVKRVRKRRGPLRYAYGLLDLVEVLRERWSKLADKTGLTEAELLQAALTGERLATGVARKNTPAEHTQQMADMRNRAFTLFVYAYGQVRRAVQYLRWANNDADTFAPSLYKRHHRRVKARRASAVQPADAPQLDLPVPPTPIESLNEAHHESAPANDPAAAPRDGLPSCAPPDTDDRDQLPSAASSLEQPQKASKREQASSALGSEITDSKQSRGDAVSVGSKRRRRALAKRRSQCKVARFRRCMTSAA